MRILCLNPNRTAFVIATVAAEIRAILGLAATVIEATADFGPDVIRTHLDEAVATHAAVDLAARHAGKVDAVLMAASYDPATEAIRALLGVPVLGISQAAIAFARLVGKRIGYVSAGAVSVPLYRDTLARYDFDRDRVDWQVIETPAAYALGDKTGVETMLTEAVERLAGNGADVAVLLGEVYAGLARRLGPKSPIPLVDGGLAGALMIESLLSAGPLASPRALVPSRFESVSAPLTALAARD
ncbi:aspartate/glutamate racemase family protein [Pseudotabrizicola sp.]|nr:aspartate/glutamate racemase family protein [Pseudotabrizicola sp.]